MQELQEEQEGSAAAAAMASSIDGVSKDQDYHMCAVISGDDKSSSSERMTAAAMAGHGEAATTTFSLLENWLLDDMPGQAAMSAAMDGFLEISAGYCCADPIMFWTFWTSDDHLSLNFPYESLFAIGFLISLS